MPFGIPAIAGLISAAIGGTELGLNVAGVGQPSQGDALKQQQALQLQQQQTEQKQQQEQQQALFKHFAPDAQAATGGQLSDTSMSALIAELSGNPGGVGEAQSTIYGTTPGLSSGTLNLGGQ